MHIALYTLAFIAIELCLGSALGKMIKRSRQLEIES
jgi:hypothetical protein